MTSFILEPCHSIAKRNPAPWLHSQFHQPWTVRDSYLWILYHLGKRRSSGLIKTLRDQTLKKKKKKKSSYLFIYDANKTKATANNSQHRKINVYKDKLLSCFFFFKPSHRSPSRNFSTSVTFLHRFTSLHCHFLGVLSGPHPTACATWFRFCATAEVTLFHFHSLWILRRSAFSCSQLLLADSSSCC